MYVFFPRVCLRAMCMPGVLRDQKRTLKLLELKLQMLVSQTRIKNKCS